MTMYICSVRCLLVNFIIWLIAVYFTVTACIVTKPIMSTQIKETNFDPSKNKSNSENREYISINQENCAEGGCLKGGDCVILPLLHCPFSTSATAAATALP